LAQTAGGSDTDEIVVTAQKREQNLQDVPIAITAIGTEKLDQLQVNEFADVVKFLPSVTIQQGWPGLRAGLFPRRGFGRKRQPLYLAADRRHLSR
jgi:outer membrane receptor protein involved in Fe transport